MLVGRRLHVSHSEPMPQTPSILSNPQKFVNVSPSSGRNLCYQTSQDLQWYRKFDWTKLNLRNQYFFTVTIMKNVSKERKCFVIKTQTERFNSKVQHFCLSIFYILKTLCSVLREETLQTTLLLSHILS